MNLYFKILVFLLMTVYTVLLYLPMNINYKKFKSTKKLCLNLSGVIGISPANCWSLIKYIYLLTIGVIPIACFFYNRIVKNYSFYTEINIIKSFILVILSFIGILEISFFMIIVVVSFLMKKDSRTEMSDVSWIKFNKKYPFYTGMLKPIIYTVFEILLYYYVMLYVINDYLKVPVMYSILGIAILYSVSKLAFTKNKEQALIYGVWAFVLNIIGSCIMIYSNSIILTFILYLLYSFIIAFKE
ncbi:SagF family protein [Clostridium sp. L74]|uniref:SagF family protein n=1 Tax=Clostridium sp. L74 TaxID=1560217 RepID=UPI0006ABB73B|nr:SagF family protein [Clostridium sp. L74]KOR25343.1 membrane protein [Clostridium sp. L74]